VDGPGIFSVAPPDGNMCPEVNSASESEYQGLLLGMTDNLPPL